MFFRQIVTPCGSFRAAGHMVTSELDPDDADTPDINHDDWGFVLINF